MILKKRQLIMATLVLALSAAVFVNWYYTRSEVAKTGADNTKTSTQNVDGTGDNLGDAQYVNSTDIAKSEYFAGTKIRRTTAHDEAKEALNNIINSDSADAEAIKAATQALKELAEVIKSEADIESLINAKTGGECVVIINNGKAEVVVGKGTLNDQRLLQITEIVMKQTGIEAENMTILELNS